MPLEVARSIDSPQSIAQAADDGVGLAGQPTVPDGEGIEVVNDLAIENGQVSVEVESASEGTANLFFVADGTVVSSSSQRVTAGSPVTVELAANGSTGGTVYLAFERADGAMQAMALPVTGS